MKESVQELKTRTTSLIPLNKVFVSVLSLLNDKPAALVERLDGGDIDQPNVKHIQAIGHAMANMHLAGRDYKGQRENCRSFDWWSESLESLRSKLPEDEITLIQDEIRYQKTINRHDLPSGVIHADLFHDNALFKGNELAGIIDFYFACNDVFLYDIAVTLNDWCSEENGELNEEKTKAYLNEYQKVRELTAVEQNTFAAMLRAGALRFWMSRLMDYHFPREGEMTHTKDPNQFKNILKQRIVAENTLNQLVA